MKVFGTVLLLLASAAAIAQAPDIRTPSLSEVLSRTSELSGLPPKNFNTPFLVVSVSPISGDECVLEIVTNGMFYSVSSDHDRGCMKHLPALHTLLWGRVRHSAFLESMREANVANVASEYIDLVYESAPKVKTQTYRIDLAQVIGPDWGR